jgi:hypothetical protein
VKKPVTLLLFLALLLPGIAVVGCDQDSRPTEPPGQATPALVPGTTPTPEAQVAGPPHIRVGQVSGLEFTDECRRILAQPAAHSICSVHDCYYFGTRDVYELIPTFDTCEELVAFVGNPCEVHRGQALTAIWWDRYLECPLGLYDLEPAAWDQVGLWLQWERRQRDEWCAEAPSFADFSNCMATGLKAWP